MRYPETHHANGIEGLRRQLQLADSSITGGSLAIGSLSGNSAVATIQNKTCSGCSALCGGSTALVLPAEITHGLPAGIRSVDFRFPSGSLIGLSFVTYLFPVLLMLLSSVVCNILYPEMEALTAVAAAAGLLSGFAMLYIGRLFVGRYVSGRVKIYT